MRRGTTARLILNVEGADISDSTVHVLFRQKDALICKSTSDLEFETTGNGCRIFLQLDQSDTLRLKAGTVNLQIRWVKDNGEAFASPIVSLRMKESLSSEVIKYE